jgi:DNA-binding MarR family transcriptional regulator
LYGLATHPDATDMQLADSIGLKRPTVTGIKNKLRRSGLFSYLKIPDFQALGAELLNVTYGSFGPRTPFDVRRESGVHKEGEKDPNIVFQVSSDTDFINFTITPNFSSWKSLKTRYESKFPLKTFCSDFNHAHFPLDQCRFFAMLEFGSQLSHLFSIEQKVPSKKPPRTSERGKLSKNELLLLYAMTKYPEYTDKKISDLVGLSKVTVSSIRRKLVSEQLIEKKTYIDVDKLGCEILGFYHAHFSPQATLEGRREGTKKFLEVTRPVFSVGDDQEAAGIVICKDYTTYKTMYEEIVRYYEDKSFLLSEPRILLFPIKKIKLLQLSFHPLVKDLVGLKTDI